MCGTVGYSWTGFSVLEWRCVFGRGTNEWFFVVRCLTSFNWMQSGVLTLGIGCGCQEVPL